MEIEVIILENGRCKTLNPFEPPSNEEPFVPFYAPYGMSEEEFFWERERAQDKWNEWNQMRYEYEQAESERQEFEIDPQTIVIGHNGTHNEFGTVIYEPNTIHRATIVNGKAQII